MSIDWIRVRRGPQATMPALEDGEPGWARDTKRLFIGTPDGNEPAFPEAEIDEEIEGLDARTEELEAKVEILGSAPIGGIFIWPLPVPPERHLAMDGAAYNMLDYRLLFSIIGTVYGTGDGAACSFADGAVSTALPLAGGDIVRFTNEGGALPEGISEEVAYMIHEAEGVLTLLTLSEEPVAFTGGGTGSHTVHDTFRVPDWRDFIVKNPEAPTVNDNAIFCIRYM